MDEGRDRMQEPASQGTHPHLGPAEPEEARKSLHLEPLDGGQPCQHLGFQLLASRTMKEQLSGVLGHQVLVTHCSSHGKLRHWFIGLLQGLKEATSTK